MSRNDVLEEAAHVVECMVVGGRAWTEEQQAAAEVLFAAAAAIRALKAGPACADSVVCEAPSQRGVRDGFVAIPPARLERLEQALEFVRAWYTGQGDGRPLRERAEALLWGVPCRWCGCAESLCCCERDATE